MREKEDIVKIAKEPGIFHQLGTSKDENSVAILFYFILLNNPGSKITEHWENSSIGVTKYNDILASPQQYETVVEGIKTLFLKHNNCNKLFNILVLNKVK